MLWLCSPTKTASARKSKSFGKPVWSEAPQSVFYHASIFFATKDAWIGGYWELSGLSVCLGSWRLSPYLMGINASAASVSLPDRKPGRYQPNHCVRTWKKPSFWGLVTACISNWTNPLFVWLPCPSLRFGAVEDAMYCLRSNFSWFSFLGKVLWPPSQAKPNQTKPKLGCQYECYKYWFLALFVQIQTKR